MIRNLSILLALIVPLTCLAQKTRILEGSLESLKGQTAISTVITYDNLIIGAGIPEKKFVSDRSAAWDAKERGKGAEWEQVWLAGQKKYYQSSFRKTLAQYSGLQVSDNAPYTIILKTIRIEPGWSGGIIGGVAWLEAEALVVNSADQQQVIARIQLPTCKGQDAVGGDFEMVKRIQQAYGEAGKLLGWYLRRKIPKQKRVGK